MTYSNAPDAPALDAAGRGRACPPGGALSSPEAAGGEFAPHGLTRQARLGQNYPNPYANETTVPFTLTYPADVRLILLDPLGRRVVAIIRKGLGPGEHCIALNLRGLGLAAGNYVYQLQVAGSHGLCRQSKTMTAGPDSLPAEKRAPGRAARGPASGHDRRVN